MPDFSKSLQSLKAADLAYIRQIAETAASADAPPTTTRKRRSKTTTPDAIRMRGELRQSAENEPEEKRVVPDAVKPVIPEPDRIGADTPDTKPSSDDSGGDASDSDGAVSPAPADASASPPVGKVRTRRAVAHEWPPVGTVLTATYFGTVYRAEVVDAKKRLKSGRQLRLLDGPSKGRRFDSLSKAMLVATARQRREQKLGRKGASNGWLFWGVETELPRS